MDTCIMNNVCTVHVQWCRITVRKCRRGLLFRQMHKICVRTYLELSRKISNSKEFNLKTSLMFNEFCFFCVHLETVIWIKHIHTQRTLIRENPFVCVLIIFIFTCNLWFVLKWIAGFKNVSLAQGQSTEMWEKFVKKCEVYVTFSYMLLLLSCFSERKI